MAERIKVLHIIKSLGRGGAEMLLPETLKLHDHSRFEFHYFYFFPWKNQLEEEIRVNGGTVTCLASNNNIHMLLKYWMVVRRIRKNNIQLIHCHMPWAGVLGRVIHLTLGIPVLYTEHNKQERYHFITRWMNRITFNWQSLVIAVSSDVASSIKINIRVRIPVCEVLNGVNTNDFQRDADAGIKLRRKLSIPDNAFVVGTIAVFRFQKRLVEWLEIIKNVSEKHHGIYGIIVGDGPMKQELIQQVKVLGLENRIIMPGLQTEVKPWLSAMNVFMMSSVFEGLPVALLEAMSMQCAIVTTDAGGIKEVIENDKHGLMVGVNDWNELEKKLIKLIEQPELQKSLRVAARVRVMTKFGIERMVRELEELYVGCLQAPKQLRMTTRPKSQIE